MALYRRGQIWHYDFWYRGRRYRGSTEEKSKTRARRMEAMLMLKAREKPGFILASRVPVLLEFAPRFLEWVEASTLEQATKEYYQYGWQMLEKTSIAQMRLDAISKDTAEVLRFPGSSANGNRALRTLRRMLGKAEEWGFISRPPRIRLLKEQGREAVISPEMEARILKVAPQPLRDVIVMILDSGMRPQDVFRTRWEHVNWHKRVIFVPYGKTQLSRRYVPMSDRMAESLLARMDVRESSGWVFPSPSAQEGHITTVAKAWQETRDCLGLDASIKLYACRHTFATEALERTGNLAAVMKTLGHSSTQTTMRYQHPGLDQIRKAVEERNREHRRVAGKKACPHKSPHSASKVNQPKRLNLLVGPPGFEPGTNGL